MITTLFNIFHSSSFGIPVVIRKTYYDCIDGYSAVLVYSFPPHFNLYTCEPDEFEVFEEIIEELPVDDAVDVVSEEPSRRPTPTAEESTTAPTGRGLEECPPGGDWGTNNYLGSSL